MYKIDPKSWKADMPAFREKTAAFYAGELKKNDYKGFSLSLIHIYYLWNVQSQVIQDLAKEGPCVIVGRCADYILRDQADCLTVFVHASMEKRAERIVKQYGEKEAPPEKRLKDKDKRRAAYYQFYTCLLYTSWKCFSTGIPWRFPIILLSRCFFCHFPKSWKISAAIL